MLREYNLKWYMRKGSAEYGYDYLETYWVVDQELFRKTKKSKCTISVPQESNGLKRMLKKVSCTEWHFYACEQTNKKRLKAPGWITNEPHKSKPI